MTFQMYVAAHKASSFPTDEGYVPIHVGKALSSNNLGILTDNTGVNISERNATFCECTALYWIWKNSSADVVGLSHYRRYFGPRDHAIDFGGFRLAASSDFTELGPEGAVDLIVPNLIGFLNGTTNSQISVEQNYFGSAIGFDLHLAREAMRKLHPSYLEAFDFVMRNCQLIPFNMLVGSRAVVNEYLGWLFPLLFTLEEWIPWQTYGAYQDRVLGFLAERLHTVWTVQNRAKYRIAHRPVVFCG